ncbi:MAG: glycosyltransferase, partial [Ekhidna sp.]
IENLYIVNYNGFVKGLHYLPGLVRKINQRKIYKRLEELVQTSFDIVWSFDNSVFFDLDALSASIKISHIVDLNQDFQTKRAASSADFCFGVTDEIINRLLKFNPRTFKISHALNIGEADVIAKLPGKNKVKALYAGNLAMKHLDWQILYQASKQNIDLDFVFIGSGGSILAAYNSTHVWKEKIMNLDNVFFLPPVSSDEIHSYLNAADILMVAYQQKHHKDQTDSHKILEYLNTGNPIVATFTAEYEGRNLLNMVYQNEEWPGLVTNVAKNLTALNTSELVEKRKSFARSNTYEKRVEQIENILFPK